MTDITTWVRSGGLQIVLFISGAVLLSRITRWAGATVTGRIDAKYSKSTALVRSESAKHSHVVAQVIMWAVIVLGYCAATVLTLQRLGVPITGLVAPAAVVNGS